MITCKKQSHMGAKWKQFLTIFTPIVITQLTLFSMTFFDTTMSGNYSNQALAGVAIGSSFWAPVNAAFSGLLMAITPIIAQLIGAKKEKQVKNTVHNGLYIALFLAFILILINFFGRSNDFDTHARYGRSRGDCSSFLKWHLYRNPGFLYFRDFAFFY